MKKCYKLKSDYVLNVSCFCAFPIALRYFTSCVYDAARV